MEPSQRQVSPGFAFDAAQRLRAHWKGSALLFLLCLLLFGQRSFAGTLAGQFQTATGGVITNGTLTFHLSQPIVIAGTAQVITQDSSCYTDSNGNIVGLPDPLALPIVTTNTASGTLASGTYYTRITYYNASGQTFYSPETATVLSSTGTLVVNPPALHPPSATGYSIYIGSTSGGETLQASVAGFVQYSQTSALVSGSSLPTVNTSVCSLHFSDEGIPTGTYYTVNLVNKNGSKISGFPQTWCTYGGANGTINVSNGAPTGTCGFNGAFYPTPIFAAPANNAPQSISGALTVQGPFTDTFGSSKLTGGGNIFTASQFNGTIMMDGVFYPCTTTGLQTALAAAAAAGGGEVDARLCSALTLNAATSIGDGTNAVTLIIPNRGTWTLSGITDGTSCFLTLKHGSSIYGHGTSNDANKFTLQSSTGVNADSMLCTDPSPTGGGTYVRIEGGLLLYNQTASTYVNGLLHIQKVFDASSVRNVSIANTDGIGLYVKGACCGATFEKVVVDGQGGTGAKPVIIDGASGAGTAAISFINLSADHAGPGQHEITVQGGGFTGAVNFFNLYVETTATASGTAHIELAGSQQGTNIYGGMVALENAADTAFCIDVAANSGNELGVYGFSCQFGGASHNAINDHNNGVTVVSDATGTVPTYQTGLGIYASSHSFIQSTPGGAAAGLDVCAGDTASNTLKCSYNNGSFLSIPQVISSGTAAMTTSAIGSGACGATVTVSATGVLTSDSISWSYSAAPAANPAELVVSSWPTANNVNFQYCNPTAGSVTPSAATLNWRVAR
jgi:hypothetical protein